MRPAGSRGFAHDCAIHVTCYSSDMPGKKETKSKGTAMAEKTRAAANRLSEEERQKYRAKAMQMIYSDDAKTRAGRR